MKKLLNKRNFAPLNSVEAYRCGCGCECTCNTCICDSANVSAGNNTGTGAGRAGGISGSQSSTNAGK